MKWADFKKIQVTKSNLRRKRTSMQTYLHLRNRVHKNLPANQHQTQRIWQIVHSSLQNPNHSGSEAASCCGSLSTCTPFVSRPWAALRERMASVGLPPVRASAPSDCAPRSGPGTSEDRWPEDAWQLPVCSPDSASTTGRSKASWASLQVQGSPSSRSLFCVRGHLEPFSLLSFFSLSKWTELSLTGFSCFLANLDRRQCPASSSPVFRLRVLPKASRSNERGSGSAALRNPHFQWTSVAVCLKTRVLFSPSTLYPNFFLIA